MPLLLRRHKRSSRPSSPAGVLRAAGDGRWFDLLGRALAIHSRVAIACWVVLAIAGAFLLPHFESSLTGPPLAVGNSDSARAQALIDGEFDHPYTEQDLIVFQAQSPTLKAHDPVFEAVVDTALADVAKLPLVVSVVSPLDPHAIDQVSADGRVAAALVRLSGSNAERQKLVDDLTAAATSAATMDVHVYVTGSSPLIVELVDQERDDLLRAERLGLPIALVMLIITSGSLVAAGLPVLLALLGSIVTFGILGALSHVMTFNLFVPNVATMIGLGVGIDYSLVIVARFREELKRTGSAPAAVTTTVATAGKTVFFSGMIVILSLAGLLLVNAPIFRELAIGAMTSVGVMVLGALTLLPAVLALLGTRIERLHLPLPRLPWAGHVWERWSAAIARRPGLWAAAALLIILAMSAPIVRLQLGLDTDTGALQKRSATLGRQILEQDFNEGRISPLQVVYVSHDGPLDDRDLNAIARLSELIRNDWASVQVTSVTTLLDDYLGDHSTKSLEFAEKFPGAVAAANDLINAGRGGNIAVIRAVPRYSPDTPGPIQFVHRVREQMVPLVLEGQDADVYVGGLSAQIVDITAESLHKLPLVAGATIAVTFVLLALVFRSIVIPIKAILLNSLSIIAAYGLLVVVFQQGVGARVFDFRPVGSTQVYLPLLTFAVLFGISMDYEIFLLRRIKEEWERTGDNAVAVSLGLQRTAGVITAAAAIMVAVFTTFTFARLMEIKQLGFSLAAAVLIDATLIRIVLVPAAMQLLGHWNWWFPAWLERRVPHIALLEDGESSPVMPSNGHHPDETLPGLVPLRQPVATSLPPERGD
jgi:RND superfamily putative drug exporter